MHKKYYTLKVKCTCGPGPGGPTITLCENCKVSDDKMGFTLYHMALDFLEGEDYQPLDDVDEDTLCDLCEREPIEDADVDM